VVPADSILGDDTAYTFSFVADTANPSSALLRIAYKTPTVTDRLWSIGNLAHDEAVGNTELTTYLGSDDWTKSAVSCTEYNKFEKTWTSLIKADATAADAANAGFDEGTSFTTGTDAGKTVYNSYLIAREKEIAANFRGTDVYRYMTSSFPLAVKLQETITVSDTVNVFAPVNVLAAITEYEILPTSATTVSVKIVIRTQTQAPFFLRTQDSATPWPAAFVYGTDFEIIPTGTSFAVPTGAETPVLAHSYDAVNDGCSADYASANLDDFNDGLVLCDQYWTITFALDTSQDQNCELDGEYKLNVRARCRDDINTNYWNSVNAAKPSGAEDVGCPIIDPATTTAFDGQITATLDTSSFCPDMEIDVGLDADLKSYETDARITLRDDFFLDTQIYFRARLWSTDNDILVTSATLTNVYVDGLFTQADSALLDTNTGNKKLELYPGPTLDSGEPQCRAAGLWNFDQPPGYTSGPTDTSDTQATGIVVQGVTYTGVQYDFSFKTVPYQNVVGSLNGADQTIVNGDTDCGMDIETDGNEVLTTSASFTVQYSGAPSKRTTHLTIGAGEEASLLSVARQATEGGSSASGQAAAQFVVSVPRGEDNTQTPGAINTGSSKDSASTLSSFLF